MKRRPTLIALPALLLACGGERGAITATLVWDEALEAPRQRGLRAAAPPEEIDRLVITALDVAGSTLATTTLSTVAPGANRLAPNGGTWRLEGVKVGPNRTLVARAYYGNRAADPSLRGRLAFVGERRQITVDPARTVDIGVLRLARVPGVRLPRLDLAPPAPPPELRVSPFPEGDGLMVNFGVPNDPDLAGFVVALTSSSAGLPPPPVLARGFEPVKHEPIAPGVRVAEVLYGTAIRWAVLSGLANGEQYRIYVYAFDVDFDGFPLNFSAPAVRDGVPRDTMAPAAPGMLSVTASTSAAFALVSFAAPGDDGANGRAARYELRASTDRAELADPLRFAALRAIPPPPVVPAGTTVRLEVELAPLGVTGTDPFFLGARAVDAAGNVGPIAIEAYRLPPMITPSIAAMSPPIAASGGSLALSGDLFGASTGTVTLTQEADVNPKTIALPTMSWSDDAITLAIPVAARSGVLRVARAAGDGEVRVYLPIIRRIDGQVDAATPPLAMLGVPDGRNEATAILYSARAVGASFEASIERIFRGVNDGTRYAPFTARTAPLAVGAAFSPSRGRFLFVASAAGADALTAALVSADRTTPNALRVAEATSIGRADGIGVEMLDAPSGVPAVIAFTSGGVLRVGRASDIETQRITTFETLSSSTAELATLRRRAEGASFQYLIAYREGGPLRGQLVIQSAGDTGNGPGTWTRPNIANRPAMGERVRILDVPEVGFVIAYEERQLGGRVDVRLLRLTDYGVGVGLAPFPETSANRRLEDLGLVLRSGRPWIALTTTRVAAGAELFYTEIDPMSLVRQGRANTPAVRLDFAARMDEDPLPAAQLGCKPIASLNCPIAWIGPRGTNTLFVRR